MTSILNTYTDTLVLLFRDSDSQPEISQTEIPMLRYIDRDFREWDQVEIQRKWFRENYSETLIIRDRESVTASRRDGLLDRETWMQRQIYVKIQRYRDRDNQTLIQRQRYVQKEGRHTETVIQMLWQINWDGEAKTYRYTWTEILTRN